MTITEEILTAYCDGLAGKQNSAPSTGCDRVRAACDLGRRHRQNLIAHYKAYGRLDPEADHFEHCWDATCSCHID